MASSPATSRASPASMLWMLSCSRLAASSLLPGPGDLSTLSRRYLGRCRCRCRRQVQDTGAALRLTWCPAPAASARCSRARGAGCPWRPGAGAPGWPPQPPSCSPQGLGWRPRAALHLAALHLAAPCSVSTSWPPSWPAAAWWRGGRTCNITQLLLLSAVPCATSPAAPGAWRGISWPQPAPARSSSTGPCRTGVDIDIM